VFLNSQNLEIDLQYLSASSRTGHSRGQVVATQVLGKQQPEVWVSDCCSRQQQLGRVYQLCEAHMLRDVRYAIGRGDAVIASKVRDHLRWAIGVRKRRPTQKHSILAIYAARAGRSLYAPLSDRRVPPTRKCSEQEIRRSVVFRKVTDGFRFD
jgi:transposase